MRKKFEEYYRPTESELDIIWDSCLFVFDTNVLLRLYRYSKKTTDSILSIMTTLNDRVWLPYHVGLEFHKLKFQKIHDQVFSYDKLISELTSAREKLHRDYGTHRTINIKTLDKQFNNAIKYVEKCKRKQPDWLTHDEIGDQIAVIFKDKIGGNYTQDELEAIYVEGRERYQRKQPPGFADDKEKQEPDKFGDLIIWKQMIDKARETKIPIVFVSEDEKEDWWLKLREKKYGPRTELVREMLDNAGVKFYIYTVNEFTKHALDKLRPGVSPLQRKQTLEEIISVGQDTFDHFSPLTSFDPNEYEADTSTTTVVNSESAGSMEGVGQITTVSPIPSPSPSEIDDNYGTGNTDINNTKNSEI